MTDSDAKKSNKTADECWKTGRYRGEIKFPRLDVEKPTMLIEI